jgi:hypothetical protein
MTVNLDGSGGGLLGAVNVANLRRLLEHPCPAKGGPYVVGVVVIDLRFSLFHPSGKIDLWF